MSATPQRTRWKWEQGTKSLMLAGNWSKTFPNKIETRTKSCLFVKKLLTVSVSNITYLRSMFPEEAYANKSMDGLPLKILKENNKVKEAATLASWLVGAFDPIEKGYLKELLLLVYLDSSCRETILEMYTFQFSYSGTHVSCQVLQGEEKKEVGVIDQNSVYKSTRHLLKQIISLTQSLRPLPSTAFLSMKLLYYDDVTPEDYEPPGYGPAVNVDAETPLGRFDTVAGEVSTRHHTIHLRVQARQVENDRRGRGLNMTVQERSLFRKLTAESQDHGIPNAGGCEQENVLEAALTSVMPDQQQKIRCMYQLGLVPVVVASKIIQEKLKVEDKGRRRLSKRINRKR